MSLALLSQVLVVTAGVCLIGSSLILFFHLGDWKAAGITACFGIANFLVAVSS